MTYRKHPHCLVTATVTPAAPIDTMMADLGHGFCHAGVFAKTFLHADNFSNPGLFQSLVGLLRQHDGANFIVNLNAKDPLTLTLDDMRQRGLDNYARRHTWEQRAGRILAALEKHGSWGPRIR